MVYESPEGPHGTAVSAEGDSPGVRDARGLWDGSAVSGCIGKSDHDGRVPGRAEPLPQVVQPGGANADDGTVSQIAGERVVAVSRRWWCSTTRSRRWPIWTDRTRTGIPGSWSSADRRPGELQLKRPQSPRHKGTIDRMVVHVKSNSLGGGEFESVAEQNGPLRE